MSTSRLKRKVIHENEVEKAICAISLKDIAPNYLSIYECPVKGRFFTFLKIG